MDELPVCISTKGTASEKALLTILNDNNKPNDVIMVTKYTILLYLRIGIMIKHNLSYLSSTSIVYGKL